ncbi:MAG: hypothetical protein M0P09_06745 [Acholeplasmataceae bacterium]|nr:hypothetical protein [Acholeplasmataceae bacterium]
MKHLTLTSDGTSVLLELLTEDGVNLVPLLRPSVIAWSVTGPQELAELTIKIQGVKLGEYIGESNGQG